MNNQNTNSNQEPTRAQIEAANALLRETMVTLSHATGIENDGIDADLAREYDDNHASLYKPPIR